MSAIGDQSFLRRMPVAPLPPPSARTGAFGWARANLFSSPANIALTLVCAGLIVWAVPPLVRFLLIDAVWSGANGEACIASPARPNPGACWAFVRVWFSYFVYGFYPLGERWRVDVFFVALAFGFGWLLRLSAPRRGHADIKAFMSDFRAAFPDLNFWGVADLIAEGDLVVGRWEGCGTHTGPAFSDFLVGSLPAATGRKMHFTGTTVLRIENGKIVEEIGLDDGVTALKQLGLIRTV